VIGDGSLQLQDVDISEARGGGRRVLALRELVHLEMSLAQLGDGGQGARDGSQPGHD